MMKYLILMFPLVVNAGAYAEIGLGVPINPGASYIPDQYGILGLGYIHRLDENVAIDLGVRHRSLTGTDRSQCGTEKCFGDNVIETKLRYEW